MIRAVYHYSAHRFDIGHVIAAGIWGFRMLVRENGLSQGTVDREILWEQVRIAHYPWAVSRLACVFTYEQLETALAGRHGLNAVTLPAVYAVELVNSSSPTFVGDIGFVDRYATEGIHDRGVALQLARAYWAGDDAGGAKERLVGSAVRVTSLAAEGKGLNLLGNA